MSQVHVTLYSHNSLLTDELLIIHQGQLFYHNYTKKRLCLKGMRTIPFVM
jgi:hypothetical protein